jgi:hypothetical protein
MCYVIRMGRMVLVTSLELEPLLPFCYINQRLPENGVFEIGEVTYG